MSWGLTTFEAALVAVGESVLDPVRYYRNITGATLNILEAMKETRVNKVCFHEQVKANCRSIVQIALKIAMFVIHVILRIRVFLEHCLVSRAVDVVKMLPVPSRSSQFGYLVRTLIAVFQVEVCLDKPDTSGAEMVSSL